MKESLRQLPVEYLQRGKYQPRHDFNPDALQELAESIQAQGIIEPIIVRPIAENQYEIVAGERRWRAAQLASMDQVPCIVRDYDDRQAAKITLIENIQREDLNPIEEARALQCLLEEFNYTHDEIAQSLGKSRAKITNTLRLLHLDTRVQQLLIDKKLSEGHGKALAGLPMLAQYELAKRCIQSEWSVRQIEQEVKQHKDQAADSSTTSADADISRLERLASLRFGAEVKFENNTSQKSGWIKVKYYDYDTLSGILEKMGVEHD